MVNKLIEFWFAIKITQFFDFISLLAGSLIGSYFYAWNKTKMRIFSTFLHIKSIKHTIETCNFFALNNNSNVIQLILVDTDSSAPIFCAKSIMISWHFHIEANWTATIKTAFFAQKSIFFPLELLHIDTFHTNAAVHDFLKKNKYTVKLLDSNDWHIICDISLNIGYEFHENIT